MQDLNDLYYFVSVVDRGGFAAAGRTLGLQKSKLSRRILQLEERRGARLLTGSSRHFSVTEIGREFYDHCLAMLVEAEAAEQVIAQVRAEPRGVVRMSCPIGASWSAAQHHDQCTHAPPLSGCKFGSLHRTEAREPKPRPAHARNAIPSQASGDLS